MELKRGIEEETDGIEQLGWWMMEKEAESRRGIVSGTQFFNRHCFCRQASI